MRISSAANSILAARSAESSAPEPCSVTSMPLWRSPLAVAFSAERPPAPRSRVAASVRSAAARPAGSSTRPERSSVPAPTPWPTRSLPFTEMSRRPAGALGSAVTSATSEPSRPNAFKASMSLNCETVSRACPVVRAGETTRLAMSSTALDQRPWKLGTERPAVASCAKRPFKVRGWFCTSPSACIVPPSLPSADRDTVVSRTRRREAIA